MTPRPVLHAAVVAQRGIFFFFLSQLTKTVRAAGFQMPRIFGGSLMVERNLLELTERQNLQTRNIVEVTR